MLRGGAHAAAGATPAAAAAVRALAAQVQRARRPASSPQGNHPSGSVTQAPDAAPDAGPQPPRHCCADPARAAASSPPHTTAHPMPLPATSLSPPLIGWRGVGRTLRLLIPSSNAGVCLLPTAAAAAAAAAAEASTSARAATASAAAGSAAAGSASIMRTAAMQVAVAGQSSMSEQATLQRPLRGTPLTLCQARIRYALIDVAGTHMRMPQAMLMSHFLLGWRHCTAEGAAGLCMGSPRGVGAQLARAMGTTAPRVTRRRMDAVRAGGTQPCMTQFAFTQTCMRTSVHPGRLHA
eukprot:357500-Chlamydomonas_euryale.AAC.5